MDYAVNIADLMNHPVAAFLISPEVIPNGKCIKAEGDHMDGCALLLECNEERAKAIIDVIRMNCKKHELRCYERNKTAWRRI